MSKCKQRIIVYLPDHLNIGHYANDPGSAFVITRHADAYHFYCYNISHIIVILRTFNLAKSEVIVQGRLDLCYDTTGGSYLIAVVEKGNKHVVESFKDVLLEHYKFCRWICKNALQKRLHLV